jgi:hypothetical protein
MAETHDVIKRMQEQVDAWELRADRRAIFLGCYSVMTRNMMDLLDAGLFRDPPWVNKLLDHFADYYFNALTHFDTLEETSPPAWRLAFQAARNPKLQAVQHLFLGVNAHINFDLVLSLIDMLDSEWAGLPPAKRQERFQDHTTINKVIARSIDEVQDNILERYTPSMDIVDRVFGRVDEFLITSMIARWRDNVWKQATRCLDCQPDSGRLALLQEVEAASLRKGQMILLKWKTPEFDF